MAKLLIDGRESLECRSANVCVTESLRQALRQCYRGIHRRPWKRIVHGLRHALGPAHLNKVVVYKCNSGQAVLSPAVIQINAETCPNFSLLQVSRRGFAESVCESCYD